jgi:hypothetical protein
MGRCLVSRALIAVVTALLWPTGVRAEGARADFLRAREAASYRASWNGIPVADAEIEAAPVWIDGKRFYSVRVEARSWKYLDVLWRMRDTIESIFDPESLEPRRFVFRQRENRKAIDTKAEFDPDARRWFVRRQQGSKVREYDFVSSRTLDPISAAYLARTLELGPGERTELEVFGGRSRYRVVLQVEKKETVAAMGSLFEAYRVTPQIMNLSRSGYAGRLRQATLWVSADERRRPLRLVSEIFIGRVAIEMVGERSS